VDKKLPRLTWIPACQSDASWSTVGQGRHGCTGDMQVMPVGGVLQWMTPRGSPATHRAATEVDVAQTPTSSVSGSHILRGWCDTKGLENTVINCLSLAQDHNNKIKNYAWEKK
jgi:hypothetical protein